MDRERFHGERDRTARDAEWLQVTVATVATLGPGAASGPLRVGLSERVRLGALVLWIMSWELAPPGSFVWRKRRD